jgi:hypothetical protein
MKKIKLIYLLTCLIFILILAGCASVKVIDRIPNGTPKGYVEVYYDQSEGGVGYRASVYSIVNGKEIYEGQTSIWDINSNKVGLRLAKRPGTYTFSVRLFEWNYTYSIKIEEGMITPIKITYLIVNKESQLSSLNTDVHPEKPVPIAEYGIK